MARRYRAKVEVMVINQDWTRVMLCRRRDGLQIFPGGGTEPGETVEQTAIREVLEETGVRCKNVRTTGLTHTRGRIPQRWAERYDGQVTTLVVAEFDALDDSLYNVEGDAMPWKWYRGNEALELVSAKRDNQLAKLRREAIMKYFRYQL